MQNAISGIVRTRSSYLVAGASVSITQGPTHPNVTARTGNDGAFLLDNLPDGEYQVTVFKDGNTAHTWVAVPSRGHVLIIMED